MPCSVRVSTTDLNLPVASSRVMTGSRFTSASISPFSMAATAPAPAPTPTIETSPGFKPAFTSSRSTNMLVDEPGAVTPILRPLRSRPSRYFAARSLGMRSSIALYLSCSTTASIGWCFAAMLIVCS
jgi:hypothetical protein